MLSIKLCPSFPMIVLAEDISINSISPNLVSLRLPSIRKASMNNQLSPISSTMIKNMTSSKDLILTLVQHMVMGSKVIKEMTCKDLIPKIYYIAMDLALN